jgi:hypothetical protein
MCVTAYNVLANVSEQRSQPMAVKIFQLHNTKNILLRPLHTQLWIWEIISPLLGRAVA